MWDFYQVLQWMKQHEALAGWAQAVGVVTGILVAVAIPAYQRWTQTLDTRREKSELDLVNAQGTFFLLTDASGWLNGLRTMAETPRQAVRDDMQRDDLLARIHALENRTTDHESIRFLSRARVAIIQTSQVLMNAERQKETLPAREMELLADRINLIKEHAAAAEKNMDRAFHSRSALRLNLFGRLLYPLLKPILVPIVTRHMNRKERLAEVGLQGSH